MVPGVTILPGKGALGQCFRVVAVYIGTVIGAGFASGQEILQFFIVFGSRGLWGAVLAAVLFGLLGLFLMKLVMTLRTTSYAQLLPPLMGHRLAGLVDLLSLAMLPGGLAVMLAGSGAVFQEQFGLAPAGGVMLAAFITALVILFGLEGVLLANMILVPVKLLAIGLVCLFALFLHGISLPPGEQAVRPVTGLNHWAWFGLLYVSYNLVVPVAVLSSLGRSLEKRPAVLGGLVGGLVLGATAGLITLAGLAHYPQITGYQVPILLIAGFLGETWRHALGGLIWLAILTTAIADAHGFASRLAPGGGWRYRAVGLATIICALPLAKMDFSRLVQLLYPLFGYAGLIILVALLLAPFRLKWITRYHFF
ncbi:MAG TPA: hypothetical protein GXX25_05130 [Desulfotomaculum sp.]|nr:hypothetical protein [Desulfotomaculum sp.]